jgi:hypothetical protein
MPDPLGTSLNELTDALERLGIAYFIGGSMASGARGIVRTTRDIDLVAQVLPSQADMLSAYLGPEWYAEPEQIREAIRGRRPFNLIHIPSGNKIDIFPATEEFHSAQLERAAKAALPFLGTNREFPIASAEDILLAKFRWYKDGGEASTRQWEDVMGIVAMNPNLDLEYLRLWAGRLHVEALLSRALTPTGAPLP